MTTTLTKKQATALRKELRESIAAHNSKKDICANDGYNRTNRLGSIVGRNICNRVAQHKNGIMGHSKLTMKDCVEWAATMLPEGAGYASQDITESIKPFVDLLKS